MEGDVLLLLAVHAQTALGRIPLRVGLESHLSHVVKQLRQMLLDLRKQTDAFSTGPSPLLFFFPPPVAVQINNHSLLLFQRGGQDPCSAARLLTSSHRDLVATCA